VIKETYFKNNPQKIKEEYIEHIHKFTINEVYQIGIPNEAYDELKEELDKKEDMIAKLQETIDKLSGNYDKLKNDVETLKNPNKYYSDTDIIDKLFEYVTINNKNFSPAHRKLIFEKLREESKDIAENGRYKEYIEEIYSYAENLLKVNPDYFPKEEIKEIKRKETQIDKVMDFKLKNIHETFKYLGKKEIKLNEKQKMTLTSNLHDYLEEVYIYENKKIDKKHVKMIIQKTLKNEKIEFYQSPNRPSIFNVK
jgi:hypothetical protein